MVERFELWGEVSEFSYPWLIFKVESVVERFVLWGEEVFRIFNQIWGSKEYSNEVSLDMTIGVRLS